MINIEDIKTELICCYPDNLHTILDAPLDSCSDELLRMTFEKHMQENLEKIKISDLVENYQDKSFMINTPDGMQEVGDFYKKGPKKLYMVLSHLGYKTISSNDHKFETTTGWVFAQNLKKGDFILTKGGWDSIIRVSPFLKEELVYDLEILTDKHRYWSGNGLSSHNTAKTYFAMAIVREALKKGYHPIYCDTEGAIDVDFVKRLGVDPSKVRLEILNTVEQFSHMAAQITNMYDEAAKKKEEMPKILIVLDSLGNLSSTKEKTDTLDGSEKRDMTKQQAIRKLFRVNGIQFAKYGIPFVVVAHTYDSMSMFSPKEISGGGGVKYNASIILSLGKGALKDEDAKKEANKKGLDPSRLGVTIFVNPYKQRFARPIKVQVHIPYYKPPNPYVGLEKFADWENCGIMRGKCLTEKQMLKLTPNEQKKCKLFEIPLVDKNGISTSKLDDSGKKITHESRYAFPKDTALSLVIKHLNGEIPLKELFSEKVFTEEIIDIMDEKIIKPLFQLPDLFSLEDEQKDLEEILAMGDDIIDERENKNGKTRQKKNQN